MIIEDKIIEQKGIGKYLGKCETNLGATDAYEKVVELIISSGNYIIRMFDNPLYPKNREDCIINCKTNLKFARIIYNEIVERDEKEKQALIYKEFSKN
ncbi:hypothetical protein HYS72_00370 [Candidatus Pacearchaeota archaeon]|nr:hypothetical protein [Candidatus Pacearchaeota archaeon]